MDLHLDKLSQDDLLAWLREALHDRRTLPKLTHDEPPDLAILRLEPTLDRMTRRDLETASLALVRGITPSTSGDEDYLRALLNLVEGLGMRDKVAPLLVAICSDEDFQRVPEEIQRILLEGLINLRSIQPRVFWLAHYERAPDALEVTALAGLLATTWSAGVDLLPRLSDTEEAAFAAATLIEQALEDLSPSAREHGLLELRRVLGDCAPSLREALADLLSELTGARPPVERRSRRLASSFDNPRFARCASQVGRRRDARITNPPPAAAA